MQDDQGKRSNPRGDIPCETITIKGSKYATIISVNRLIGWDSCNKFDMLIEIL